MKKLLLCSALLLASLTRVAATEYAFGNFDTTLNTSTHVAWIVPLNLELGKFASGFTPTTANVDSWGANWLTTSTGFYDPSGPEWGASLSLVDNSLFALNSQLYVWAYNNLTGGGREWALFTDTNWRIQANSPIDPSFYSFDFSAASVALVGTFDFGAQSASTASVSSRVILPVPEPGTYGLVAGLSTLVVALWRRRRSA